MSVHSLSQVVRPLDIIETVPHFTFGRYLKGPKEWGLMTVQRGIQEYEHIRFPHCRPRNLMGSHILTAMPNGTTFEWTHPHAKWASIADLEGQHVRVWRYKYYDLARSGEAIGSADRFFNEVADNQELSDYDELEYIGFLLQSALGAAVAGVLDSDQKNVCSTGATAASIRWHKEFPHIPRYFRFPYPFGDRNHLKAEQVTPAHFGCWHHDGLPTEFDLVYEERKAAS